LPDSNVGLSFARERFIVRQPTSMSIIKVRKPSAPFEVIDRASVEAIKDPTALAVWVFLRCKPEGWIVRETHVREQFGIGRDKYRACMRYLAKLGAVEDRRIQGEHGRIIGRELIVNYAVAPIDGESVSRVPENPSHGDSNDAPLDREPENPSLGARRAPEKPVRRRKPTDGESAPLENSKETREHSGDREQTNACARDAAFADFWKAYPAKKAKQDAAKAFAKLTDADIADVLADIPKRAALDRAWLGGYVPNPATYLRGRRWEDEITPAQQPGGNHAAGFESAHDRRARINAMLGEAGRRAAELEMD
jgi:hypothetical protein